jgi:ethanolamine utilization protein EutM
MPGLIKNKALGLIETVGLVGAIEACDAASKAADVIVSAAEIVDPALVTIKIFGELGAVQAAVGAGSAAAAKIGQLLSSHIIPNPDSELEIIMGEAFKPSLMKTPTPKNHPPKTKSTMNITPKISSRPDSAIDLARLEKMRVTELRNFARTISNLGIKGREISRADKETLLDEIKKASGKSPQ